MSEPNLQLVALGQTIRTVREERGMTPAELATAANLDQNLLEAIEDGRHDPHYDVLLALADALQLRLSTLATRAEGLSTPLLLAPGERKLTSAEFQQHFGHLPTDDEG